MGIFGVLRGHRWVFWGPPVPPLGGLGYFGAKCGGFGVTPGSSGATVGYFGVLRCHHWGDMDILAGNPTEHHPHISPPPAPQKTPPPLSPCPPYPLTWQWAAVSTQFRATRVPPQMNLSPWKRAACQGRSHDVPSITHRTFLGAAGGQTGGDLGSPRGPPRPPLGILGSSGATIGGTWIFWGQMWGHGYFGVKCGGFGVTLRSSGATVGYFGVLH